MSCGNPIDIGTGNKFEQVEDYKTAGQNRLAFKRYYNSFSLPGTYAVTLGPNWRMNYDRYLHFASATMIQAERADGRLVDFALDGGVWSTDSDIDLTLTSSGGDWLLTDRDDTVETYSSANGHGQLDSIALRNGYTRTLSYSSGAVTTVTDSYGRSLSLSYSSAGLLTSVDTPDDLVLSYGYTTYRSAGLLTSVSYNTSPATSQTYLYENDDYPYALTGITDENGIRFASWEYDGYGRAVSSEHAGGTDRVAISYDSSNGRTVTGPLGSAQTYIFSTLQDVLKVTEIDRAANGTVAAASRTFSYDSAGYLASATDWNGNLTAYVNNTYGDPTQIVYASGTSNAQTTDITYDTTWVHLPATIETNGVTEDLSYDSSGNLLTRTLTDTTAQSVPYSTNGDTRTTTYTYTSTGQLASVQLPRTDVSAVTYYSYSGGTLTGTADALAHETNVLTYQSGGLPLTIEDQNGVVTTLSYNARNWLTGSVLATSAGDLTTSFAYDSAGNLTTLTLPDDSTLSYTYDSAHRLTATENALGENRTLTLDSAGNVTQALWKDAGGTTRREHDATFDALGRMLTDVGGEGQTTSYTYDNNGNVQTITDPLGYISYRSVDELNRLTRFEDAEQNVSTITYDSHNRVTAVTDPRGNVTSYVYDGYGDTIQVASPDTGTSVLYYDSDGNLTESVDATGAQTDRTYDALGRILTRTYVGASSLNVSFTYDQSGHGYGIGRLTSLSDQSGDLSRSYDARGNIITDARTINSDDYTNSYTYDSAGRLSAITYASSGWVISYGRDDAGQIAYVSATQPGHSAVTLAADVTHMPFGPVSSWTYGNSVADSRTFDLDYRMTAVNDAGSSTIMYLSYGYDANGNVTSITNNVNTAYNQTLAYDSADQLVFASGSYGSTTVTYDSNGNRLSYGGTSYTYPTGSNKLSQYGSTSISYTSAGNISAIGSNWMVYNKANQLGLIHSLGVTSGYTYDAFGQRLGRLVGTNPLSIDIYDLGGHMLSETNSAVETDYAYMDGLPIAAIQPAAGTVAALHTDNIGTVQRATNSAQSLVWAGAYGPFGTVTPLATITMNLRFPGQYSDASGLNHNGLRDYNKTFGRYMEADPIGLAGGLNPYVYVLNNPYRYSDPLGLETAPVSLGVPPNSTAYPQINEIGAAILGGSASVGALALVPEAAADLFAIARGARALSQGTAAEAPGEQCVTTGLNAQTPAEPPDFIVSPGGTVFPVPRGASGPFPAERGIGVQFTGGQGGLSLETRVSGFRYMNPTTTGKYPYPSGRATYTNSAGQAVNPLTGKPVARSDPWAHIPGGK